MATTIQFHLNNLTVNLTGAGGYIDTVEFRNLDPVTYVFQITHRTTGNKYNYSFGTQADFGLAPGFIRYKTDEVYASFSGAYFPGT